MMILSALAALDAPLSPGEAAVVSNLSAVFCSVSVILNLILLLWGAPFINRLASRPSHDLIEGGELQIADGGVGSSPQRRRIPGIFWATTRYLIASCLLLAITLLAVSVVSPKGGGGGGAARSTSLRALSGNHPVANRADGKKLYGEEELARTALPVIGYVDGGSDHPATKPDGSKSQSSLASDPLRLELGSASAVLPVMGDVGGGTYRPASKPDGGESKIILASDPLRLDLGSTPAALPFVGDIEGGSNGPVSKKDRGESKKIASDPLRLTSESPPAARPVVGYVEGGSDRLTLKPDGSASKKILTTGPLRFVPESPLSALPVIGYIEGGIDRLMYKPDGGKSKKILTTDPLRLASESPPAALPLISHVLGGGDRLVTRLDGSKSQNILLGDSNPPHIESESYFEGDSDDPAATPGGNKLQNILAGDSNSPHAGLESTLTALASVGDVGGGRDRPVPKPDGSMSKNKGGELKMIQGSDPLRLKLGPAHAALLVVRDFEEGSERGSDLPFPNPSVGFVGGEDEESSQVALPFVGSVGGKVAEADITGLLKETNKQDDIKFLGRILKHERDSDGGGDEHVSSPHIDAHSMTGEASKSGTHDDLYYVDWNQLTCVNDPAQRPAYLVEVGEDLFRTAEECCKRWLSSIANIVCEQPSFSTEATALATPSIVEATAGVVTTTESPDAPPLSTATSTAAIVTTPPSTSTTSQSNGTVNYNTTESSILTSLSTSPSNPESSWPSKPTPPLLESSTTSTTASGATLFASSITTDSSKTASSTVGPVQRPPPTSSPAFPTSAPTDTPDCICNYIDAATITGFIQKPNTTCANYIQCSEGHIVNEFSCPKDMIFSPRKQICSWKHSPFEDKCDVNDPIQDQGCQCEYLTNECFRSLQNLSGETISTWKYPEECTEADRLCSAGEQLFEDHKANVCASGTIQSACGRGNRQSCFDEVSFCCGFGENKCDCELLEESCNQGSSKGCSAYADLCCDEGGVKDRATCKCDNMKKSCSSSLKSSSSDAVELSEECQTAENTCCKDCGPIDQTERHKVESCQCSCEFWDGFCISYPGPACDSFAKRCCGSPDDDTHSPQCYCEVYEEFQNLNYDLKSLESLDSCARATEAEFKSTHEEEKELLSHIYNDLGGANWLNSSKWLDNKTDHCEGWYGVKCSNAQRISERRILEIDLTSNNLVGTMDASKIFSSMYKLQSLKLANNMIQGGILFNAFYELRNLKHIDIGQNNFSGEVDVLLSPAIKHLDLSHNNFTSMSSFKRFKRSYQTLEVLDLSHNGIKEDISKILKDAPSNLRELLFTANRIHGSLPNPLPYLGNLEKFIMKGNNMTGQIPDVSRSFLRLKKLDLSNQKQVDNEGFLGPIPAGWANLPDFVKLDLSKNSLTGTIPLDLGNLPQLGHLNLSHNKLRTIPNELGKLAGISEVFDMSNNEIEGKIPSEFGAFKESKKNTLIYMVGNKDIERPAPLALCNVTGFDLSNDREWCPHERKILSEIFDSTKGGEWTESDKWMEPYTSHCDWQGVRCNNNGDVIELNLTNNGLSGKLTQRISELHSLQVLDLSDNDIKDTIPSSIGNILNLTRLRLSFNSFRDKIPTNLKKLQHLELFHVHGNRLSGEMPSVNIQNLKNTSSFIADCGYPTDFEEPISCPNCTICCNSNQDCHSAEPARLEQVELRGFENYVQFLWVFTVLLFAYTFTMVIVSSLYEYFRKDSGHGDERVASQENNEGDELANFESNTRSLILKNERQYALESIGEDSVYSYILSKSRFSWILSLAVAAFQSWALINFVRAAPKDFTDETSDWIYSWKCPRNSLECKDESDLNWEGWVIFIILMIAHVLKDVINGMKLLIFCGGRGHGTSYKIRSYFGGFILTWVSALAIYASAVYNIAIARSQTDIIANAVFIMFVVDVDEYFHKAAEAARSFWSGKGGKKDERDAIIAELSATVTKMSGDIMKLQLQLKKQDDEIEKQGKEFDDRMQRLERVKVESKIPLQSQYEGGKSPLSPLYYEF